MTNIKTFEDACQVLGIETTIPAFTGLSEQQQKAFIAHYKLVLIIEAINEGWTPDWNNDDEYKYYPWFDMENGFVLSDVYYFYSFTFVGSRLCFESREKAKYVATQFIELYRDYFLK